MRISYSLTALANAISAILIAAGTNVTKWSGSNVAAPNVAGYPLVDTHYHRGTAENVLQSGRRDVYVGAVAAGILGVKSVQYGTITIVAAGGTTGTTTITTVTTGKVALINLGGWQTGQQSAIGRIDFQDTSNVRLTVPTSPGGDVVVGFCVVEFY